MDFSSLLARLKHLGGALTATQRITLAVAFVTVVAIVGGSALWLNNPRYVLLFADMQPEAAADVVARLKNEKVPYELDAGGRSIRVAESRVDELRLGFASQGLPTSGRIGFEIFDRTQFGATEFLEQVNYRRALEGELARTIGTLAEVAGARVHIATAKSSLFAAREQAAKASVVLRLKENQPLPPGSAQGIANLVAASVEGLRPESVVILDSFGRPLVRPAGDEGEPLGSAQVERQQRLEKDLVSKVVALLEPVVGADGLRVNVSARLGSASEEQTEEKWDPDAPAIRSRQTSGDTAMAVTGTQQAAGSRANLPETDKPAVVAAAVTTPGASRTSETTNYELSRTTRHVVKPRGDLVRLSVAVIVDHDKVATKNADGSVTRSTRPRTPEELQKIQGVVAAAVGLDPARGDQLTVENVPFDEPIEEEIPTPTTLQRVAPYAMDGVRVLGVIAIALCGLLFVVRPLFLRVGGTRAPATAVVTAGVHAPALPRSIQDLEGEIEAQLDAVAAQKSLGTRKLPVLTRRVSSLAQKDPEHAARLVRMWMAEDPQ